jgi:hypothetical protein
MDMNPFGYTPVTVTRRGDVTVERFHPDYNDLSWQCLSYLFPGLPPLGPDAEIADAFRYVMGQTGITVNRTLYANPAYLIRAEGFSWAFLNEARIAQKAWLGQFNDGLASSSRVRREMDAVLPIIRQLMYTGVLVVSGRHVMPNRWPTKPVRERSPPFQQRSPRIEIGERFKALEVIEALPGERYLCRCECGNTTVKMRTHLFAGRATSCGCRRDRQAAAVKQLKQKRAWIHTGELPG